MPDALFAHPRLAPLYDELDGSREDLDHYQAIAHELGARSVLDIGCGTGCLALLLAAAGLAVTGVDPAAASLDIAMGTDRDQKVRWVHGTSADVSALGVDLVVMTGNVAQVFVEDEEWRAVLRDIFTTLGPGGHLAFETRRPDFLAWEEWEQDPVDAVVSTPQGVVCASRRTTCVSLPLVSFAYTFTFPDGSHIVSDSTLRFRGREEIEDSLQHAGFHVVDVRQAPDAPTVSTSFIAQKAR
ncbi:MAG: class I SAM-dependent methyltransferase [Streptosporangiales bacterium]